MTTLQIVLTMSAVYAFGLSTVVTGLFRLIIDVIKGEVHVRPMFNFSTFLIYYGSIVIFFSIILLREK